MILPALSTANRDGLREGGRSALPGGLRLRSERTSTAGTTEYQELISHLARRADMAPRTFARAFRARTGLTPMWWLNQQHVAEAQRLLEATDLGVDEIADRCGFGTAVSLRAHMSRHAGLTPTAYRATFRGPPHRA